MLMVTELMGQWSVWSLFKYIHVDIHWSYFTFCYQGNMYTKYHTHQAAGREVDAWHWDVISMTYRKLNVRSPLNRRRKMKMRAERKKDKEMMISRGGATEAAITRKALLVHPTLSLGGYLWLCSPPPLFFLHITPHPPLPVTRIDSCFCFPGFTDWGSDDSGLWDINERSCNNEELGIWPRVMSSGPYSGLAALSSTVIMKCWWF